MVTSRPSTSPGTQSQEPEERSCHQSIATKAPFEAWGILLCFYMFYSQQALFVKNIALGPKPNLEIFKILKQFFNLLE